MRIPTDRYVSADFAEQERERSLDARLADRRPRSTRSPTPATGRSTGSTTSPSSIVRGKDGVLRGFVNACRHRGNVLCREATGNTGSRFVCPYHLWSYDLEGGLRGVARPDLVGDLDKAELGLLEVPVDTFAGFVFLNPDPDAVPLAEFLGPDAVRDDRGRTTSTTWSPCSTCARASTATGRSSSTPSRRATTSRRSTPSCCKIVVIDPTTNRFRFWGDHEVACAPFAVADASPEDEYEGLKSLPDTFPTVTGYLPRLAELVDGYRDADGQIALPPTASPGGHCSSRRLARRSPSMGLDVDGLTDAQMTDNHGWLLFPNFFMTIRAAEATVITAVPHPDGDPNRCIWHIRSFMWLPEEYRDDFKRRTDRGRANPNSYPYFLALQQDYDQMPRQQVGLRNTRLEHLTPRPRRAQRRPLPRITGSPHGRATMTDQAPTDSPALQDLSDVVDAHVGRSRAVLEYGLTLKRVLDGASDHRLRRAELGSARRVRRYRPLRPCRATSRI